MSGPTFWFEFFDGKKITPSEEAFKTLFDKIAEFWDFRAIYDEEGEFIENISIEQVSDRIREKKHTTMLYFLKGTTHRDSNMLDCTIHLSFKPEFGVSISVDPTHFDVFVPNIEKTNKFNKLAAIIFDYLNLSYAFGNATDDPDHMKIPNLKNIEEWYPINFWGPDLAKKIDLAEVKEKCFKYEKLANGGLLAIRFEDVYYKRNLVRQPQ